jgi:septal ring factor EnvC (AmiA/AmiB activator)
MRKLVTICLVLLLSSTPCFASSTPKNVNDLCARAAAEVKAGREYIAKLEAQIETYKQEQELVEKERVATEREKALQLERIELLEQKIRLEEEKIALQQEKIDVLEARIKELTEQRDGLRRSRNRLLTVVSIGALAVGWVLGTK